MSKVFRVSRGFDILVIITIIREHMTFQTIQNISLLGKNMVNKHKGDRCPGGSHWIISYSIKFMFPEPVMDWSNVSKLLYTLKNKRIHTLIFKDSNQTSAYFRPTLTF